VDTASLEAEAFDDLPETSRSLGMEPAVFGVPELDQFVQDASFRLEKLRRVLRKLVEKQRRLQRRSARQPEQFLEEVTANSLTVAYGLQALFSLLLRLEGDVSDHHVVKREMERCCNWARLFALEDGETETAIAVSDATEEQKSPDVRF
jgi:hypothetical protein